MLKEEFMEKCLKDKNIQQRYEIYLSNYKTQCNYFKSSQQFTMQGTGDINLYKLFVEKSFELLDKNGVFGMVIPSEFYYGDGTKK